MNSKKKKSLFDTKCMKCGREIPAGMYYREVSEKGTHIGDLCYTVCKPEANKSVDLKTIGLTDLLLNIHPESPNSSKAKDLLIKELRRRIEQMKQKLNEIEADERLGYPTANIQTNAPLALVQLSLESHRDSLRWVLKTLEGGE